MTSGPKSDKLWSDAIRKRVLAYTEIENEDGSKQKIKNINLIAANLIAAARKGDMTAIKEIGDRLDGKPQSNDPILPMAAGITINLIDPTIKRDDRQIDITPAPVDD